MYLPQPNAEGVFFSVIFNLYTMAAPFPSVKTVPHFGHPTFAQPYPDSQNPDALAQNLPTLSCWKNLPPRENMWAHRCKETSYTQVPPPVQTLASRPRCSYPGLTRPHMTRACQGGGECGICNEQHHRIGATHNTKPTERLPPLPRLSF